MEKILLASYSIKIFEKNNPQLLSIFNGEDDFLSIFSGFCDFIYEHSNELTEITPEGKIHLTLENKAILDLDNRVMFGYFASGVSGDTYKIRDTETNETIPIYPKHAAFRDVFFYLYVPKNTETGYLILQRKSKFGVKTILNKTLNLYLRRLGYDKYFSKFYNILHHDVYKKMIEFGNLKKVDLVKKKIPNSIEKFMSGEQAIEQIPGNLVVSFSSTSSLPDTWKNFLDKLFKQKSGRNERYEIDLIDEQYDEIEFQLELDGKTKTFYMVNSHRIQPDIDVTSSIELVGGEPTIESMVKQAKSIINDIIEIKVS